MSCQAPVYHKRKREKSYECFPCGKCPACRARRASAWSFRLMQEEKVAHSAYFLTLTYNEKNVPRTRNGFMEIHRRDLQLFFKRLRKMQSSKRYCKKAGVPYIQQPLKYYAVGEYGGRFKRPHYHVIMFNASAELIERAWTAGHVHYGYVAGASVGYTMKYISKPSKIPIHRNDDRTPEFSLMSKGLGESYLTRNMISWHNVVVTQRCYVLTSDGKKVAMPRYYRDRLYSKDEKKYIAYFAKQEQLRKELLITPEQLHNSIETINYQFKKINNGKNKAVVASPVQCSRVSEALRGKHLTISNNSRSGNVVKNITRKVHARAPFA